MLCILVTITVIVTRETMWAAFYVEKGGVGKTTSAAHIAVAAASTHDLDVILLDLAGTQKYFYPEAGPGDPMTAPTDRRFNP
jgi:chromosome partitioning protein